MIYPHPTWIEVDRKQFLHNLHTLRRYIGKSRLCLMVKANGYGHGLCQMGKLAEPYVDCLGVSCLQEGVRLRQAGIEIPILVLGAIHEDQIDDLVLFDLEFTISSKFKADLVAKKLRSKCRVHLEVETGMQRTGVRCATAIDLFQHLKTLPCFEVAGIYSHFASSAHSEDPIALKQLQLFRELLSHPIFRGQSLIAHMASTGAVVYLPESHLDMVRLGLLAYGYLPKNPSPIPIDIAPCFSLKSRVSYFKVVAAGEGISYGHTYVTSKQTRIVTVPIGFGDGYLRALSNRGSVLIRGKRFPIAGAICMDQFMVDVGDSEVFVGDEVVLIGKQGSEEIKLTEIATLCDTILYEILCLFNERIPRVVV